jgi:hypothetical protein
MRTVFACLILGSLVFVIPNAILAGEDGLSESPREMRPHLERFSADLDTLQFKYRVPMSSQRHDRLVEFYEVWLDRIAKIDFSALNRDGEIDFILFKNLLVHDLGQLRQEHAKDRAIADLLDFSEPLIGLLEDRENLKPMEGEKAARVLHELHLNIEKATTTLASKQEVEGEARSRTDGIRASRRVRDLNRSLRQWYAYYAGYDPLFTWWCKKPYETLEMDLRELGDAISTTIAGIDPKDQDKIVGEPIGAEALAAELRFEMIPYSPEELVEIAEREFAWCDAQMAAAAKELGFGDDWRAAQEHVKDLYVPPGQQPDLIRELAEEAVDFVESRNLLTVPPLCKESWRMEMMSPERQKVSPYFLGGPTIIVSYPTDEMSHADKLMSLRGNNPHFSRATVHHELIPGHHLQAFVTKRFYPYRQMFRTPFWIEGWALYWEMLLWDLDFPRSAEDRVGMLFWRKHRCARIIFSLNYHLEKMTPDECVDFLVERVGHERNNAEAEVRRSVMGGYGPLYQAAYMLGGLQIRSLYGDFVQSGTMSPLEFHDIVIRQNAIPIAMIRARLSSEPLSPDFRTQWRFAEKNNESD